MRVANIGIVLTMLGLGAPAIAAQEIRTVQAAGTGAPAEAQPANEAVPVLPPAGVEGGPAGSTAGEAPAAETGVPAVALPANETAPALPAAGTEGGPAGSTAGEAPAAGAPEGPMSATDRIVARFMALDTDTSGSVSLDEYMAMVQQRAMARYQAMDSNGDGEVSDKEYRAFWKSRLAHWYRLKR